MGWDVVRVGTDVSMVLTDGACLASVTRSKRVGDTSGAMAHGHHVEVIMASFLVGFQQSRTC